MHKHYRGGIPSEVWAEIVEAERRRRFLADVEWTCGLLGHAHAPATFDACERALAAAVRDERYGPAALEIVREKSRLMEGKAAAADHLARVFYHVLALLSTLLLLYRYA